MNNLYSQNAASCADTRDTLGDTLLMTAMVFLAPVTLCVLLLISLF